MYRKFIGLALFISALGMAVFAGGAKDQGNPRPADLNGTVWAAPFGDSDWITLAFRAGDGDHGQDVVIQSASPVNGDTAHVEYSYDTTTRIGAIPDGGDPGDPPGAFSLADDGKTIIFADFIGSGSQLIFRKLFPDTDSSFVLLDPLPGDLKNTVWVSEGFRVNDWITIIFAGIDETEGNAEFAHVADSSQNTRTYTYDAAQKTGVISYVARDFVISDNDTKLQLRNFYGHEIPVDFKRVR
jgi:hypothetical protein